MFSMQFNDNSEVACFLLGHPVQYIIWKSQTLQMSLADTGLISQL